MINRKQNEICIICEDTNDKFDLKNSNQYVSCNCNFLIHKECWTIWRKTKQEFECPLCGTYSPRLTIKIPTENEEIILPIKKQNMSKRGQLLFLLAILIFAYSFFSLFYLKIY